MKSLQKIEEIVRKAKIALPLLFMFGANSLAYNDAYTSDMINNANILFYSQQNVQQNKDKLKHYARFIYDDLKEGYCTKQLKQQTFDNGFSILLELNEKGYIDDSKIIELKGLDKSLMVKDEPSGYSGKDDMLYNIFGPNANDIREISAGFQKVFQNMLITSPKKIAVFLNNLSQNGLSTLEQKIESAISSDDRQEVEFDSKISQRCFSNT